jgi:hypothetical protein
MSLEFLKKNQNKPKKKSNKMSKTSPQTYNFNNTDILIKFSPCLVLNLDSRLSQLLHVSHNHRQPGTVA